MYGAVWIGIIWMGIGIRGGDLLNILINLKNNSIDLVRKRTILSDRRLSEKLVPTFA
jgi:hypothetical protein